jgi:hypothetical protein
MPTPEEIAAAAAKTAADEAAAKVAADEKAKNDKELAPVPYSRFSEVNEEKKALEKKLKDKEDAEKVETEKRLAEQNQYKELSEKRAKDLADLQPKAAQVDAYEKTLQEVLNAQIEEIPEGKRTLVPEELTTQQKLAWIAKNKAILKAPGSFDIGAGKLGADGKQAAALEQGEVETATQYGMTAEEYAKYKDPRYSKVNEAKK